MLAALAGTSLATFACKIEVTDAGFVVTRETDGGTQMVALEKPAVVTSDLRLAEPRYVTLPSMARARKKPVEQIDFASLAVLDDAAIIQELIQLKGVGVWTAEMLLIFSLGRPDVLSFGDLGIRRGIMLLTGRDSLSKEEFETFRRRCSPYGTLASLYLWRIRPGGIAGN